VRLILLTLDLYLPQSHSLKDKRRVIKGLKDKLRARFNVSVAETDYQDAWQRSLIAIALIALDNSGADRTISLIRQLVDELFDVQVVNIERTEY